MARRQLAWAGTLAAESRDELGILRSSCCAPNLLWPRSSGNRPLLSRRRLEMPRSMPGQPCSRRNVRRFSPGIQGAGRSDLAEERRSEAARLFQAQGASRRLRELEEAWD